MDRLVSDAGRLALGTAQWGSHYGIANETGQPTGDEVAAVAAEAWGAGVRTLDTARGYGDAETVIGSAVREPWRIITKVAPDVAGPLLSADEARTRTLASLAASRTALRRERLDVVLLHRAEHRDQSGGAAWKVLREEQAAGRVRAIGASVVRTTEAALLLEDPSVQVIQVPANLLDQRLATSGFFEAAAHAGREVVVRSVYLQGVAHLAAERLPPHLGPLRDILARLDTVAADAGVPRWNLFLAWARRRLGSATILIGCETAAQLRENLAAWEVTDLETAIDEAERSVPELPDEILDPWRWQAATR